MSGLLHRLARQLAGPAPPRLHAGITQPFAPLAVGLPDAESVAIERAMPARERAATTPPTAGVEMAATSAAVPPAQPGHRDASRAAGASPTGEAVRAGPPVARLRHERDAPDTVEPPALVREPQPALGSGQAPLRAEALPEARAAHANADPTLLRPLLPRAGPQPTRAATATQPASGLRGAPLGTTPTAASTEVHVHIGRIEVTAIQDAPAPSRKPPQLPLLSLDEYLDQRAQGRR